MREITGLTLVGLFLACVPTIASAETVKPATEATDPDRVAAERRFPRAPGQSDAYYAAKIVAALQFKATPDGRFIDPDLEDRFQTFSEGDYSIWGCGRAFGAVWDSEVSDGGAAEPSLDPARERELELQDIAYRAVALRLMLARIGIAESRTAPAIAAWEAARLADFAAGRESVVQTYRFNWSGYGISEVEMPPEDHALMVRLNRTAKAGLTPPDGCGAGEFAYFLKISPADAPAAIIRQFDFDLCRVRGIQPTDRARCRGWRNVVGGQPYLLSGNYRYVIDVPGKPDSGSFTAQRTQRAMEEGETIVIGSGAAQ